MKKLKSRSNNKSQRIKSLIVISLLGFIIVISPIMFGISKGYFAKSETCPKLINGDFVLDQNGEKIMEECPSDYQLEKNNELPGIMFISEIGIFIIVIGFIACIEKRLIRDILVIIVNIAGIILAMCLTNLKVTILYVFISGFLPIMAGIVSAVDILMLNLGKKDILEVK